MINSRPSHDRAAGIGRSRSAERSARQRGSALVLALSLVVVLAGVTVALGMFFRTQVHRTRRTQAEAQLRMLLVSGQTLGERLLNDGALDELEPGQQGLEINLPAALQQRHARIVITPVVSATDTDTDSANLPHAPVLLRVHARLGPWRQSQTLRFDLDEGLYYLTSAELD